MKWEEGEGEFRGMRGIGEAKEEGSRWTKGGGTEKGVAKC